MIIVDLETGIVLAAATIAEMGELLKCATVKAPQCNQKAQSESWHVRIQV